jgi:spore maturation protein CgeB
VRIVFGYLAWAAYAKVLFEAAVERARAFGYDVVPFCLTPGDPKPRYAWSQLDAAWRSRDSALCDLRDRLDALCADADVFWNVNGANVHPSWLADLPTLNVYGCFDDPESTSFLSEPVARYFDAAFVGNLACLPMYRSWGLHHVAWCPIGIINHDFPSHTPTTTLLNDPRPTLLSFVGERESPWRQERLDRLVSEFPEAIVRGNGWPLGRISDEDRGKLYRKTRIGWNIHNSLGPINVRLFALPANGVLQICDNRCRLGQFMKLEHEVIGFDTMDECIDRTRYFLKHEDERREIAANGHRRYLVDYSERRIWDYYAVQFREWLGGESRSEHPIDRLRWKEDVTTTQPKVTRQSVRSRLLQTINSTLKPLRLQISRTGHSTGNAACANQSTVANALQTEGTIAPSGVLPGHGQCGAENSNKNGEIDPANQAFCWAISTIVGEARQIICSGNLSSVFATEASADPRRRISVVNSDSGLVNSKCVKDGNELQPSMGLDLAVSINEVGPAADYLVVLGRLVHSALRVIVATTESGSVTAVQDKESAIMQSSWTSGEFYWVLRGFWNNVSIYHMPSPFLPELRRAEKKDQRGPLVAVCRDPRPNLAGKSVKDS